MDSKLKQQLDDAIEAVIFNEGPPARLAEWVKGRNPRLWYGVEPDLALLGLTALIRQKRSKTRIDSGQLPLPGFEHVPAEIGGAKLLRLTLSEYRKRRQWFEAWLKGQQRRSRADQIRLTEMRRFERECAPFCAGNPGILMEEAWAEKQRSLTSRVAARNRKQASKAAHVRWGK